MSFNPIALELLARALLGIAEEKIARAEEKIAEPGRPGPVARVSQDRRNDFIATLRTVRMVDRREVLAGAEGLRTTSDAHPGRVAVAKLATLCKVDHADVEREAIAARARIESLEAEFLRRCAGQLVSSVRDADEAETKLMHAMAEKLNVLAELDDDEAEGPSEAYLAMADELGSSLVGPTRERLNACRRAVLSEARRLLPKEKWPPGGTDYARARNLALRFDDSVPASIHA